MCNISAAVYALEQADEYNRAEAWKTIQISNNGKPYFLAKAGEYDVGTKVVEYKPVSTERFKKPKEFTKHYDGRSVVSVGRKFMLGEDEMTYYYIG
ncbi:hypothetical protein [Pseudomonas sp. NPDC079086]|uniref:hypothetical protein n=1 Tax=unclassified Pseudomonas TaxID=196821 RepID=UPI0037CBF81A